MKEVPTIISGAQWLRNCFPKEICTQVDYVVFKRLFIFPYPFLLPPSISTFEGPLLQLPTYIKPLQKKSSYTKITNSNQSPKQEEQSSEEYTDVRALWWRNGAKDVTECVEDDQSKTTWWSPILPSLLPFIVIINVVISIIITL